MNQFPFPYMPNPNMPQPPYQPIPNKETKNLEQEIEKLKEEIKKLKKRVTILEQGTQNDYLKKEDGMYMLWTQFVFFFVETKGFMIY